MRDRMTAPKQRPLYEAHISIGGVELAFAESLSLRVGLEMAIAQFADPHSCGTDEHGRIMRENYLHHLGRVRELVLTSAHRKGLREP